MSIKKMKKKVCYILAMLCLAVSVVSIVGCSKLENEQEKPVVSNEEQEIVEQETEQEVETQESRNVLGEGQTKFNFSVVDKDAKETTFEIRTDKKTVGEALLDVNMIEGDNGAYGLYVKTVNGITADYDVDKTFLENGILNGSKIILM